MNQKIIYIMGCGRSGTTLVSILLGNNKNTFNLGEIVDYAKFQGKPNGFDPATDNYQFWDKVGKKYRERLPNVSIDDIYQLTQDIEYHRNFPVTLLNWHSKKKQEAYSQHINSLFDSMFDVTNNGIIIDSSKYPGRAAALLHHLKNKNIYIVYVARDPRGVVNSFGKKDVDQSSKGFWAANVYYFTINLFCSLVKTIIGKNKFIKVNYDEFVFHPEAELEKIQHHFGIDLSQSIEKARNNQPLDPGFVFNGNRMRLNQQIKINRKRDHFENNFQNRLVSLINGVWY